MDNELLLLALQVSTLEIVFLFPLCLRL
jgi:hypothetical protein